MRCHMKKRSKKVVRRTKLEVVGARGSRTVKKAAGAVVAGVAAVALGAYAIGSGFVKDMLS